MAMASTGISPFSPTVPSVETVQMVNRAGSAVIRDGESALSIIVLSVMPVATVDFTTDQPTVSVVDQLASSVAIRTGHQTASVATWGQQYAANVYIRRNSLT